MNACVYVVIFSSKLTVENVDHISNLQEKENMGNNDNTYGIDYVKKKKKDNWCLQQY